MKTITKIEANRSAAVHRKCRVAAYCRVSTEHDDQIESLETQKAHYESWIKLHTEWESAGSGSGIRRVYQEHRTGHWKNTGISGGTPRPDAAGGTGVFL